MPVGDDRFRVFSRLRRPNGVADRIQIGARRNHLLQSVIDTAHGNQRQFVGGRSVRIPIEALRGLRVDPTITYESLPSLGERLALPEGWTYRERILDAELAVDSTRSVATVPGTKLFTRILYLAYSAAMERVSDTTAPLDAV